MTVRYETVVSAKPALIHSMEESNWEFVLTGSRRFSPESVTNKTDYDFYAEHSYELVRWLLNLGFTERTRSMTNEETSSYCDANVASVYTIWWLNFSIDVQLTHNFEERDKANKVAEWIDWTSIPKDQRCHVWNGIFSRIRKNKGILA